MQTQTNTEFKRKIKIGRSFLNTRENGTTYVEVTGYAEKTNRHGETNPFLECVDLKTGEQGDVFIDGGLLGKLNQAGGPNAVVGKKLELTYKGMVPFEYTDEKGKTVEAEINDWEVFEIE